MQRSWKTSLALLAIATVPFAGFAGTKPGEAASIDKIEIKGSPTPGGKVTAIVHVKVDKGFHTQSNKPSEPTFIPTKLTLETPAGVKAGTIQYPEGKSYAQQGVTKPLSVYEENFDISVPLALKADATLPLTINATLGYQACNESSCFAPQKVKFEITLPATK
jgi:DsbC/DsbD-like thiol-disulfide interchange protein